MRYLQLAVVVILNFESCASTSSAQASCFGKLNINQRKQAVSASSTLISLNRQDGY
jgi:hypothetical protein